jgi:hypothetical protein
MIDCDLLHRLQRERILDLVKIFFPQAHREGNEYKLGSVSDEKGNSLGVRLTGPRAGLWHDRATGEGGDFVELLRANRGLSFLEAVGEIERALCVNLKTSNHGQVKRKTPAPDSAPYQLTKRDCELMMRASFTLRKDPSLIEQVRSGLALDAVQQVATEGDLGFCQNLRFKDIEGPAVLFGYSHGVKARWKERQMRWYCGSPAGECWRQSLLLTTHTRVYITEGEPDALTLISLGYDVPGESLVVALASAGSLPKPEAFSGKDLLLIPDDDEAGRRCTDKFRTAFATIARSIRVVDLTQH